MGSALPPRAHRLYGGYAPPNPAPLAAAGVRGEQAAGAKALPQPPEPTKTNNQRKQNGASAPTEKPILSHTVFRTRPSSMVVPLVKVMPGQSSTPFSLFKSRDQLVIHDFSPRKKSCRTSRPHLFTS